MSHTPTPWVAVGRMVEAAGDGADICTCNAALFGQKEIKRDFSVEAENAQFIAMACNAWNDPKALRARLIEMGW